MDFIDLRRGKKSAAGCSFCMTRQNDQHSAGQQNDGAALATKPEIVFSPWPRKIHGAIALMAARSAQPCVPGDAPGHYFAARIHAFPLPFAKDAFHLR